MGWTCRVPACDFPVPKTHSHLASWSGVSWPGTGGGGGELGCEQRTAPISRCEGGSNLGTKRTSDPFRGSRSFEMPPAP
jgi:hypothetical protein